MGYEAGIETGRYSVVRGWSGVTPGLFTIVLTLGALASHAAEWEVSNTQNDGVGSLRWAIEEAIDNDGEDEITFDLPPGSVIQPTAPLPALNPQSDEDRTIIRANRDVILSGQGLIGDAAGLELVTDNDIVAGLVIINFPGPGILIEGDNNRVRNCLIGTDGTSAQGNLVGILVENGDGNIIGADENPDDSANVISGNDGDGIVIEADAAETVVAGNLIGPRADGTLSRANGGNGITDRGTATLIGGASAAARNTVSGNTGNGIQLEGSAGAVIIGNYIGLNEMGNDAIPNQGDGLIDQGIGTQIGGAAAGEGNVIGGNNGTGISVRGAEATERTIQGNFVGTTANGLLALSNDINGILLRNDTRNVVVGGAAPGAGNVVSGNDGVGIRVEGDNISLAGNLIGLGADGSTTLGNGGFGVRLLGSNNLVGGDMVSLGNVVSNNSTGISVGGNARENVVRKNSITANNLLGIDLTGNANNGIAKPSLTAQNPVVGTGPGNATIDLYVDDENEGGLYVGTTSTGPGGGFSLVIDLSPYVGQNLTATATTADGTSEFSAPLEIEDPIVVMPEPDLFIQGLVIDPLNPDSDDEVTLTVTVGNSGDATSPEVMISIAVGTEIIDFFTVRAISPGNTIEVENAYTLAPDIYGIAIFVDSENEVMEPDEDNNKLVQTLTVTEGSGGCTVGPIHTADQNADNAISLSELLRVIQFFNSGGFSCAMSTEDGYAPGSGNEMCCPHDSDYASGADFQVSLSELLRLIQFFNSGGYTYCPAEMTEDDYCPGAS